MKEERTAGPLHSAHSMQLLSPRYGACPHPPFSFSLAFTSCLRYPEGSSGVCPPLSTRGPSLLSGPSQGPGWPTWGAVVQCSASLSPLLPLVSLCSALLHACHLTAHSVPHWLVLSITIYLLLEWQQPLHLTSLFHQLWIDYWMWTSARACCWTHLLAGIR